MKNSYSLTRICKAIAFAAIATALHLPTTHAQSKGIFEISGSSYTANDSIFESSSVFSDGDQKVDLVGGDITFGSVGGSAGGYVFTLGAAYGSFDSHVDSSLLPGGAGTISSLAEENHVLMAHAMVGYRYSYQLTSSFTLFAGVHAGLSTMGIVPTDIILNSPTTGQVTGTDDSYDYDFGFVYVLETGVSMHITESFYIFASYQFSSSSAAPEIKLQSGESIKTKSQSYQTIRAGLGFSF